MSEFRVDIKGVRSENKSAHVDVSQLPKTVSGETEWPWVAVKQARAITIPHNQPRVSIVTPSFNQARFLEKTIRSVLLQGYANLEYSIIDGGSTDGSVEIIRKYEPWLTHWRSKPDHGQSDAINTGMQRRSGAILAWLNSDDYYLPGTLNRVAAALTSPLSIYVGAALVMDGEDSQGKRVFKTPSFQDMLFRGNLVPQPSTFWTADLWEVAGPVRDDLHYVMDYDLWLRMFSRAERIIFDPAPVVLIQNHSEQKTRPQNFSLIEAEKFKAVMENLEFLNLSPHRFLWQKWRYLRAERRGVWRALPLPRRSDIAALLYGALPKISMKILSGP